MTDTTSRVAAWITWPWRTLDQYLFPNTTAVRLAMMRIILVSFQMVWFLDPLTRQLLLLRAEHFIRPRPMIIALMKILPEATIRTPGFISFLWYATFGLGVLAVIGLFSRASTFLFGVINLLLVSHMYSYGEYHHAQAIYLMAITFIGMGPCGQCLSVDAWLRRGSDRAADWGMHATTRLAMWPILLAQWLLVIAYFEAFAAKMSVGGLQWMNGYTLQVYMLQDAVRKDMPLGFLLCRHRGLCVLMSIGALAVEGGFFIVMFNRFQLVRRITPWIIFGGAMLHTMIFLTQKASFFEMVVLYTMWVPWERYVPRWISRWRPTPTPAVAAVTT